MRANGKPGAKAVARRMAKQTRNAERGVQNQEGMKAGTGNQKPGTGNGGQGSLQPVGPRGEFLAVNPRAAAVDEAITAEFREKFCRFMEGLQPALRGIIDKAEQARQVGIILVELAEQLPGKRLTKDFYEQYKHVFVDGGGKLVSFELLEWFMKCARSNHAPIADLPTALRWQQPLLLAAGGEFRLEVQRPAQVLHPPPNPLTQLKERLNCSALAEEWGQVKRDPNFFPGGRLRQDLREVLRATFEPSVRVIEEIRNELGL